MNNNNLADLRHMRKPIQAERRGTPQIQKVGRERGRRCSGSQPGRFRQMTAKRTVLSASLNMVRKWWPPAQNIEYAAVPEAILDADAFSRLWRVTTTAAV